MKENSKSGIITVGALISAVIVLLCIWTAASKVFAETRGGSHETKEQVITESFDSILVNEVSADVNIRFAEGKQAKVEYCDTDTITHEISVRNNTLEVKAQKKKSGWLGNIFGWIFSFDDNRDDATILYLPEGSYETLTVNTVSGDIETPDGMRIGRTSVATVSGDVLMTGTHISGQAGFESVSGEIELSKVSAGTLLAETVSGEVTMDEVDVPGSVTISTVSGDVTGNILGSHSYSIHTLSGEKEYPAGGEGAPEVAVSTTSGDVRLH